MARREAGITAFSLAASEALQEIKASLEREHGLDVTLWSNTIRAYGREDHKPVLVYRIVLDNVHAEWTASSCADLRRLGDDKQTVANIGPIATTTKDDIIADFWQRCKCPLGEGGVRCERSSHRVSGPQYAQRSILAGKGRRRT